MKANELEKSALKQDLSSEVAKTSTTTSSVQDDLFNGDLSEENHPETLLENSLDDHEDDGHEPLPESEKPDYSQLSKSELISHLEKLINKYHVLAIKDEVEAIKQYYFKKRDDELEILRKAHEENNETEEAFNPAPDPLEPKFKELYKIFKDRRFQYNQKLEHVKEENLLAKRAIIEEIKTLISGSEINNDAFNEFKALQTKWREIGPVPNNKTKDLWDTYHHFIDQFYDLAKITKELKELDFKKNLEVKLKIIEKTKALLEETSILKAQKVMQRLHNEWKEAGPVPSDKKEEVWLQFKALSDEVYQKYQTHFDSIKEQLNANLEGKKDLCQKVESLMSNLPNSPKGWDQKTEELLDYQKQWKNFGFAPKSENSKIYERFRGLCDTFYDKKREFYAIYKESQHQNIAKKVALCERAEQLKSSTEWKKTADELIKLQQEWKAIGPTPKKQSDALWSRFRGACDEFFAEKEKNKKSENGDQSNNLELKKALIQEALDYKVTPSKDENIEVVKGLRIRWQQIGHVPFKEKDKLNDDFNNALNNILKKSAIESRERGFENFKSKLSNLKADQDKDGSKKIIAERNQIISKLRALENEISTLENNIGFFSKSKTSGPVIAEITKKIEEGRKNVDLLNQKLDEIDKILKG